MKFTVQLTPEDCIAARWVSLRPRPLLRYLGYCVLALMILVFGWQLVDLARGRPVQSELWWIVAAAVYLGFIFFVIVPWRIRKIFRQQKTLKHPFEVEFGESHFSGSSTNGSFTIEWADLHKWKIGKKCLLIYQSEAIMHPIPCRAFASEADRDAVVRLLEAKMGKEKP